MADMSSIDEGFATYVTRDPYKDRGNNIQLMISCAIMILIALLCLVVRKIVQHLLQTSHRRTVGNILKASVQNAKLKKEE